MAAGYPATSLESWSAARRLERIKKALGRKHGSRTARVNDVDLLVRLDRAGREFASNHQRLHQRPQAVQLPARGSMVVEVPHQADAESDLVLRLAGQVAAIELFGPALAHGDLPVAHAAAIARSEEHTSELQSLRH